MPDTDKPDTDALPESMPKRPTGDVGQGARQTAPVEDDPASLARQVIERRGW